MVLRRTLGLSIVSVLLFSILTYSNVYSQEEQYVDVLIGITEESGKSAIILDEIIAEGGDIKYNFTSIGVIAASVPEDVIDELALDPNVAYIEPDAMVYAQGHTSSLPEYKNAWGVDHIEADKVHANGNTGDGVRICILDTGMDYNHPDLAANYIGGKDFTNFDNDPMDDHGHGTHVAGIAAAVLNGAGVVGVAPDAQLLIGKVLNKRGAGPVSDVIAGTEWCVDNGAQIISMSFADPLTNDHDASIAWRAAVDAAYSDGVLLVAAAGNVGNCAGIGNNVLYPAKYASVIAVAATERDDSRLCTPFGSSSTGPQVELSAPGDSVLSTALEGRYVFRSGTSMATPHVAGAAALVLRSDETIWASHGFTNGDGVWTNGEVRTVLDMTAQDLGFAGRDKKYGFGLVRPDLVSAQTAATIQTILFSSFSANVIAKEGCDIADNRLKVKGEFTLNKKSDGINPIKDHVTLTVGPFVLTIPGGSFNDKNNAVFNGEIDNIKVSVKIKNLGNDKFKFKLVAKQLDISWVTGVPLLVKLNIDDLGELIVTPTMLDICN